MRKTLLAFAAALLVAPAAPRAQPVSQPAGTGPDVWLAVHLGAAVFQGSELRGNVDPGYDFGVAVGTRFNRWLGVEGSAAYVQANGTSAGIKRTVWDVPIAANLRARWPTKVVEASIFAGAALHLASLEVDVGGTSSSRSTTAFGFQVGGALDFHVTRTMLVGADVERSFVPATFGGASVPLDALRLALVLTQQF
jgi:opacity protein-like surface antigen